MVAKTGIFVSWLLMFYPIGWISLTGWFHSILRRNLPSLTLNTWVSILHKAGVMDHTFIRFLHIIWRISWLCLCHPVNLLSLELTYFCSGILFAAVVRKRVWDYALTVTLLHVVITSLGEQNSASTYVHSWMANLHCNSMFCFRVAVMLEFPTVWQWWLALGKHTPVATCLCVVFNELIHSPGCFLHR